MSNLDDTFPSTGLGMRYFAHVAVATLLISDYFETLPSEIRYIWQSRWSIIKILFILTRYSALVDTVLAFNYGFFSAGLSPQKCHLFLSISCVTSVAMLAFSEGILFIRVCAITSGSRLLVWALFSQYITVHVVQFVLVTRFIENVSFLEAPITRQSGCIPLAAPHALRFLLVLFVIFVVSAGLLVLIMCAIGIHHFKSGRSSLFTIFFRDGLAYFAILAGVSIGNIIFSTGESVADNLIGGHIQGVIHAIIAPRMILHLRRAADASVREDNIMKHWRYPSLTLSAAQIATAEEMFPSIPRED
ncbi:hypothetical protein FA15DRAFT_666944 [Coprinopsis marcescibilis]|uniref:DUF6533 domain-containing protein n=1 Tax=Coprinopsis marcescibilis TaxID=230819 RepID=A0A5C3L1Z2_COPMA|nr:hypothetical protein FA15DRAFT_666944 [Coprinopsis marcescibilis]